VETGTCDWKWVLTARNGTWKLENSCWQPKMASVGGNGVVVAQDLVLVGENGYWGMGTGSWLDMSPGCCSERVQMARTCTWGCR